MRVEELTRSQLELLKQDYLCNVLYKDESVSYNELADSDVIVSDEEVFEYYGGIEFSSGDFFFIIRREAHSF